MKTTEQGRLAETAVAEHLQGLGYKILARNWRTRRCEIDLVAQKQKVIYFVEVKYRAAFAQGEGLEYITAKKLKQMNFAAEVWTADNNWSGDYRLLAASASGPKVEHVEIIEI